MPTLTCCGGKRNANSWRIASNDPAYIFQRVYKVKAPCPGVPAKPEDKKLAAPCGETIMRWRGEKADGSLSDFFDIDKFAQAQWLRRCETEEARPEAQLMSEYSHKIASGNMVVQFDYQLALTRAHRWYKGERVKAQ